MVVAFYPRPSTRGGELCRGLLSYFFFLAVFFFAVVFFFFVAMSCHLLLGLDRVTHRLMSALGELGEVEIYLCESLQECTREVRAGGDMQSLVVRW